MASQQTLVKICELIEPLDKKNLDLGEAISFASDLELDSLTVMDLVADIEDEFDILLPINLLPELETIGDVADAVDRIVAENA